ncbi:MAG: YdeI/OmpD-associated family protein [Chitinophagaceae bacterium]
MDKQHFEAAITKLNNNMLGFAVPEKVFLAFNVNNGYRVLCTLNDKVTFHAAINRLKDAYYIYVNRTLAKELSINIGSTIQVSLEPDETIWQFSMPEVLEEALNLDTAAKNIFDKLTPGNKRSIMHWVSQPKTIQNQVNRAVFVTNCISQNQTNIKTIVQLFSKQNSL